MDSRLWTPFVCLAISFSLPGQQPLGFVPLTPCRIVDTRNAPGPLGGPAISGGSIRNFVLLNGSCGVPPLAAAYSLNVTVVPQATLGYLQIWPAGAAQPAVSTLNSPDGRIKANAAIVTAGAAGAVSIFVSDTSHVVLDLNGYFAADPNVLSFYSLPPCRVLDTRLASGPESGPPLVGGEIRAISMLTGLCDVPAFAQAYVLNFTAVPHGPLGYVTAWPAGTAQPLVSILNAPTGTVVANAAIVPAGNSGDINVLATDNTDLVIDVAGYFAPPGQPGGLAFYSVPSCRLADTRRPAGTFGGPSLSGAVARAFPIPQGSCAIPMGAQAYSLNATVVPSGSLGYLVLAPSQNSSPQTSTLNSFDGAITSNEALVTASPDGSIEAFASNSTDLILDINGYFADSNTVSVVPPQSHSVELSWQPSASPNIVGYNLYRSSISGGPYALINAGLLPKTSYEDNDVLSGQTYYYVSTAVDSSNVESVFSNEASVTVPN